jgi:hypothetical protein
MKVYEEFGNLSNNHENRFKTKLFFSQPLRGNEKNKLMKIGFIDKFIFTPGKTSELLGSSTEIGD